MEKYIYLVFETINWKPISMGTWTIARNMMPSFLESRFPQERKEGKKTETLQQSTLGSLAEQNTASQKGEKNREQVVSEQKLVNGIRW